LNDSDPGQFFWNRRYSSSENPAPSEQRIKPEDGRIVLSAKKGHLADLVGQFRGLGKRKSGKAATQDEIDTSVRRGATRWFERSIDKTSKT
jgi:hypothetical protein